ncbi:hypothetical protein AVEN_119080-1 [Araneus ventricosus]|uniref:Uncharacterized protein n=1 Tax=Araneus ventricosus TaxID=182803 RepID=A0A4Y2BKD4_ARAVE|nr:hypothetical protein AVEN_119080-1 [Araneus ventricosus]
MAKWVKAFNDRRQNAADMRRPGPPSVSEEEVYALAELLGSNRCHTIRELARETGLAHTTVLHILRERLDMRKMDLMHVTSHPPTRDLPEAAIGQS